MKLLEEFKERKVKEVFLEVRESNFPAIKLYYKLGFKEIGRRKGYYKGEDALIMKLTLAKI
jgi:ribosomal-protein-alanine N-acetyltransferase